MPILTEEVEVLPMGRAIPHYKNKGYDVKHKQPLTVNVKDLPRGSDTKIEVLCDMCHKNKMMVKYNDYNRVVKNTGNYVCKECSIDKAHQTSLKRYGVEYASQLESSQNKRKQTNLNKYGVEYPIQLDLFQEKRKQTNLERFGVENYAETKECQEKMKQTCMERYGVEYASQFEEITNKARQTCIERYGVEYAMQSDIFKEKVRNTNLERYGVNSPMKVLEFKEKLVEAMYRNGTQKTSKQQYYLHRLYGGELNYPIKYYDIDICLVDEKLAIEYDGSGHNLSVKFGDYTQEEFDKREIIRSNVIKKEGYKQIKIISKRDKLPNDNILLQMLLDAKQYFSTTNHSWIYYDIDNSKMINAENKNVNGVFYNYGVLRAIKEIA